MAQELILLADVEGLGREGETVKVSEGYARNYLIPRKLAAQASPATLKRLERLRKEREAAIQKELESMREAAARIEAASVSITAQTGEDGKLFGSVTPADIAAALKKQGIEVDKRKIELDSPIKEIGVFQARVKLHREVEATLKVWVVEE